MVSVIAFLTFTNIALGYGLAIYVQREFGTLMWSRNRAAQPAPSSDVVASEVEAAPAPVAEAIVEMPTSVAPAPVLEATPTKVETAPAVTAPQAKDTAAPTEAEPAPAVDEENVLAGIEEFRSQLAKMSTPEAETSEQPKPELAAAAN